jgi:hypothetical protein
MCSGANSSHIFSNFLHYSLEVQTNQIFSLTTSTMTLRCSLPPLLMTSPRLGKTTISLFALGSSLELLFDADSHPKIQVPGCSNSNIPNSFPSCMIDARLSICVGECDSLLLGLTNGCKAVLRLSTISAVAESAGCNELSL